MKTIIAGSRRLDSDLDYVWLVADAICKAGWRNEITEVVSGGARGIDLAGEAWAESMGLPIKRFIPDWDSLGKAAGCIRNAQMATYADALVLIWDGKSKGSMNMLKEATKRHLKTHVYLVK